MKIIDDLPFIKNIKKQYQQVLKQLNVYFFIQSFIYFIMFYFYNFFFFQLTYQQYFSLQYFKVLKNINFIFLNYIQEALHLH
ncbi:hypothetical protein IMG5_034250 [Ichthyophthirius multifiliis]|uniref:Transmembrane protein n=1 Tax=Ichthyophthirius multifiliis TaxID=5932 RepID=G0QLP3_ICHMU|nr:hypothetical protein IMG5_034250 [Ichthyophthirius multifiliis]EGR33862.1 hypothetical protein IMG5_034250 [Ichthyophthirius multifiliis]|eukprot:XP_004039086.1 hypothetical protein IMG5_034250 [Ichthyophthirius multifiliis]